MDGLNDEDCNSTTEVNIENVSENDVCEEKKQVPSQLDVSVEIHLEKWSSKEAIQEVQDSSHDVTLSSTSGEGDKSTDSSFSKFHYSAIYIRYLLKDMKNNN